MNKALEILPTGFFSRLKLIGPGIVLAAVAIGSGELILTPRAGALYGNSLAWVILTSIIYKLTLTLGLARYTVSTGEDIFQGFSHLPGPRNWFVWFLSVIFLLGAVGYSGIALACGSALYAFFPSLSMAIWAVIIVILAYILLLSGSYQPVEKVAFILSFILIAGVVYSLISLHPQLGWFLRGLVPKLPAGSGPTAISLLGWTAGGTSTLIYTFWAVEKSSGKIKRDIQKGANLDFQKGTSGNLSSWISVAHLDVGLSYILMLFVSLAFLMIGVIVLHNAGLDGSPLVPAKEETMIILSRLLTASIGPQAKYIFLVAAFAILYSTVIGLVDGKSRAFRSAARLIWPKFDKMSDTNCYRLFATLMSLVILAFLFTARPVVLILVVSALEAPVLSLSAVFLVYLLRKRVPKELRPGLLWYIVIWIGTLVYLILSSVVFIDTF